MYADIQYLCIYLSLLGDNTKYTTFSNERFNALSDAIAYVKDKYFAKGFSQFQCRHDIVYYNDYQGLQTHDPRYCQKIAEELSCTISGEIITCDHMIDLAI